MATYGVDLYGGTTYGPSAPAIDFKVEPFVAAPNGYNSLRISWTSPSGAWTEQRLVKNKAGYPSSPDDGVTLISTSGAASDYVDINLQDGVWYYYALWLNTATGWQRGGTTSGLSVGPKSMQTLLLSKIPEFYKYAPKVDAGVAVWEPSSANIVNPNALAVENKSLRDFVGVLGWGLDYLQDYHQTLMSSMDPHQMHIENLAHLAATLGVTFEPTISGSLMRKRVNNAGVLARQGGTLDGLRGLVADTLGWDVNLSITPNRMLTEDISTFTDPQYDVWDSGTNYPIGAKVEYRGWVYQALLAPGVGTTPPSSANYPSGGESNSTWQNVTTSENLTLNNPPSTNDTIADWSVEALTPAALDTGPSPTLTLSGLGLSAQVDGTVLNDVSNSIVVKATNSFSGAVNLLPAITQGSRNDGNTNLLPVTTVLPKLVALPQPTNWDVTTEYATGSFVLYEGRAWKAAQENINVIPAVGSADWTLVGFDERIPMQFSFYNYATSSSYTATPGILFLDAQGNPILTEPASTAYAGVTGPFAYPANTTPNVVVYDAFLGHNGTLNSSSAPDIGFVRSSSATMAWATTSGVAWGTEDGQAYPSAAGSSALVTIPTGSDYLISNVWAVAATPIWTTHQYLVVNNNASTHQQVVVSKTGVGLISAGTYTEWATFSTPLTDGERITAVYDPHASGPGSIRVFRGNATTPDVTYSATTAGLTGWGSPLSAGMQIGTASSEGPF